MNKMLIDIWGNIGEDTILEVGKNAGLSESVSKNFSENAMEMLLGGLAKNIQNKSEGEKVLSILKNDHIHNLEKKGEILSGVMDKEGNGILSHIFLDKKEEVFKQLAKKNGTDRESAKSLMEVLAPLFMGGLAKTVEKTNMDSDVLARVLILASESDNQKVGSESKIESVLLKIRGFISKFIKK
jgi:hypothetical protein